MIDKNLKAKIFFKTYNERHNRKDMIEIFSYGAG